jgi:hypothetical protein
VRDFSARVEETCRCAALVGREQTRLSEMPRVDEEHRAQLTRDFRGVSVDDKIRLVRTYNRIIMDAHPGIQSSFVGDTRSCSAPLTSLPAKGGVRYPGVFTPFRSISIAFSSRRARVSFFLASVIHAQCSLRCV